MAPYIIDPVKPKIRKKRITQELLFNEAGISHTTFENYVEMLRPFTGLKKRGGRVRYISDLTDLEIQ